MARPLLLSDLDAKRLSPEKWDSLTTRLGEGAPRMIQEPTMTSRFFVPGRRFDFRWDWSPEYVNASVKRLGATYLVRAGIGLISHFAGLSHWMLTDPHIAEVFFLPGRYPSDDVSEYFIAQWFEWVVWHEFGHAACGPLDAGRNCASTIQEFDTRTAGEDQTDGASVSGLRKAMELDADVAALNFLFMDIAHQINNGTALRRYRSTSVDPFLFDLGASFALLFAFWQRLDEAMPHSTHPVAAQRALVWYIYAIQALDLYVNDYTPEYGGSLFRGLRDMLVTLGDDGKEFLGAQRSACQELSDLKSTIMNSPFAKRRQMRLPLDLAGNNIVRKPNA